MTTKTKPPKTLQGFREYLQNTFDMVKDDNASDCFDQMEIADQVEEVCLLACRFGAGDLIGPKRHIMTPREALAVVGQLLAWVEKELRSPLLNVHELATLLGCNERTVWRWEAKGLIPEARRVGGLARWDRDEIEDWLEKQTTSN